MELTWVVLLLVAAVGCLNAVLLDGSGDSELDTLKARVSDLEETLYGLVDNIETECKHNSLIPTPRFDNDWSSGVSCPVRKTVAFMAQISGNVVNSSKGDVIVWDQVHTNEGSAYNAGPGIFTAPANGTYNFNLVASSPPIAGAPGVHWLHLFIMKNNVQVGYVFLDDNPTYWLRRSTDVTFHLVQGDQVWVQVADVRGLHILGGCCFHSHFSGFLINGD